MVPQEGLDAATIFLPAFAQPGPPGPLHPEFVVVEQPFEDLHRPFQFAREREVPRRIDRDPASPRVPGSRPPKDFAEPSRLPVHDGRDRSEREPIAQAPSCCLVHPGVQDVTRSVIEDLRIGVEKADRGGLFLEGRAFPQARRQAVQITRIDVAVAPSESRDDGPQFRHRDTEYGNGRAQVGLGRLGFFRRPRKGLQLSDQIASRGLCIEGHRFERAQIANDGSGPVTLPTQPSRERINTRHQFQRLRPGGHEVPWGLQNRLARIIRPEDGHTVMLAADHGYFLGPTHKLEIPRKTLEPLLPFADAVMVTRGVVRTSIDPGADVPIVLRVSGGASVLNEDLSNEKVTTSMKEAVRLNASAVALSIFVGAAHEHDSLVNLGKLVVAGGPKLETELDALELAYEAIQEGARGVDMGRNIWQSSNPVGMIRGIRAIVHERSTPKEALDLVKGGKPTK